MQLECAPKLIRKFNENKSYCDSKEKKFFWTLKFNFLEHVENKSQVNLLEISKENNFFKLGDLRKFEIKRLIELNNFESFGHLFNEPIDDSVNTFNTLFEFLLKNKDLLNFETLRVVNKISEKTEDLVVLMRLNIFDTNDLNKDFLINNGNYLVKIKDCYYRVIEKDLLIKDLIKNNIIHEYPEFEIFDKRLLDKIL